MKTRKQKAVKGLNSMRTQSTVAVPVTALNQLFALAEAMGSRYDLAVIRKVHKSRPDLFKPGSTWHLIAEVCANILQLRENLNQLQNNTIKQVA